MKKLTETTVIGGVLLGALGVILFSSKAVMVKLAYYYEVKPVTLLLWRMLFAAPFYAFFLYRYWKKGYYHKFTRQDFRAVVLLGFIGYYLASYLDFTGLQYITASLERLILFIYPTLVVFLSAVFLKTPITKGQIIAILITYAGVVCIFGFGLNEGENIQMLTGGAFIMLSALSYASYLTGSQVYIQKCGAAPFTSLAMLISSIVVIFHQIFSTGEITVDLPTPVYGYAMAMSVIATIIPSYLISAAIHKLGASTFSIVGSLGPVSTILLSMWLLDEKLSFIQITGGLVIISGVVLVALEKQKKQHKAKI